MQPIYSPISLYAYVCISICLYNIKFLNSPTFYTYKIREKVLSIDIISFFTSNMRVSPDHFV